ncbi:hypothetical protein [Stutzerimonas chloritidismutans]|uniref:hypothetical protein n=1 Tax=Stutzerimonas chloritidismutans TaxID=203192 RepID=UPI00384E8742
MNQSFDAFPAQPFGENSVPSSLKGLIAMFIRSFLAIAVSLVAIGQAQAADSYITTEQFGTANTLTASQAGDSLGIAVSQGGSDNEISIDQSGQGSTIRSNQQGEGNYQRVYQYNSYEEYSGNHSATIDQVGGYNTAVVLQGDDAWHAASITQDGERNTLTLEQSVRVNNFLGSQSGTGNQAAVIQEGGASAEISQTGTNNTLNLHQTAWPFGAGTSITQTGDANVADVRQTDAGRYSGGDVNLTQSGAANEAEIDATGAWSVLDFAQSGTGNQLTVDQSGRNTSITGTSNGDNNRVDIDQTGDVNVLELAQDGSDNVIEARQGGWWGEGDIGTISQIGTANFASLTQNLTTQGSPTNVATILQNGMNNSATVVQGQ